MASSTTVGARQLTDVVERRVFDPLNHQLRDPVACCEPNRFSRVEVHHDHLDLATVPRVDGARGVDERNSTSRC
jgi:hypothetical protein